MEINSEMDEIDHSPVMKKRRKKDVKLPKSCIIHVDQTAEDSTFSGITEQSWKVIFHSILLEKFLWATFALISMKLYSILLKIFKAFRISEFKIAFLEFEIFSILKLKLLH